MRAGLGPAIGRSAMPSKASASSSGARVTAKPRRMSARMASWSCVIETRLGVKPAARQVRTIRPSLRAAVQSSSARSAMRTAGTLREPVAGRQRDHEALAQEVVALEVVRRLARARRVLEAEREMQLAGAHALGQVVAALVDADLDVGVALAQAGEGVGDEPGERGREGADAQPDAAAVGGRGDLGVGELEALGDGVGVREQDLALGGEPQAAGLALEQARADLALEGADLVGDRGLGERERAGGAGERAVVRDGAERQHATRIHSHRLSDCGKLHLKLSPGRAD